MNKFQKVAYQIAKDDSKKGLYRGQNIVKIGRKTYSVFNKERVRWSFEKCVDYKNWSKNKTW